METGVGPVVVVVVFLGELDTSSLFEFLIIKPVFGLASEAGLASRKNFGGGLSPLVVAVLVVALTLLIILVFRVGLLLVTGHFGLFDIGS